MFEFSRLLKLLLESEFLACGLDSLQSLALVKSMSIQPLKRLTYLIRLRIWEEGVHTVHFLALVLSVALTLSTRGSRRNMLFHIPLPQRSALLLANLGLVQALVGYISEDLGTLNHASSATGSGPSILLVVVRLPTVLSLVRLLVLNEVVHYTWVVQRVVLMLLLT